MIVTSYVTKQLAIGRILLFTITEALGKGRFRLQDQSGASLKQSVNCQMRKHLLKCFQEKVMTPFPQTKPGPHYQSYFPLMEIELFCLCLIPETYDDMVECESCGEWYHLKCAGLQTLPSIMISKQWKCINC